MVAAVVEVVLIVVVLLTLVMVMVIFGFRKKCKFDKGSDGWHVLLPLNPQRLLREPPRT